MNVTLYLSKDENCEKYHSKGHVTVELRGDSAMIKEAIEKLRELGYKLE